MEMEKEGNEGHWGAEGGDEVTLSGEGEGKKQQFEPAA